MSLQPKNLKSMSIEKLSALRDQVDAAITAKVAEDRRTVQEQLSRLDRLAVGGARAKGLGRGLRGANPPKYRNPDNPAETWAGRGLKPRWLSAALKSGKKLEDLAIGPIQKKTRGRRKKAKA